MGRKDRRPAAAERLAALHAVGDARAARDEARRVLAGAEASEADREAARSALARASPEPAAALAVAAGALLFAVAALLGLLGHR